MKLLHVVTLLLQVLVFPWVLWQPVQRDPVQNEAAAFLELHFVR